MIVRLNDTSIPGGEYVHTDISDLSMDELAEIYAYCFLVLDDKYAVSAIMKELRFRQSELHEAWERINDLKEVEDRYEEGYQQGLKDACTDYERGYNDGYETKTVEEES